MTGNNQLGRTSYSNSLAQTGYGSGDAQVSGWSKQGREIAAYEKKAVVAAHKAREDYKVEAVRGFFRRLEVMDRMRGFAEADNLAIQLANGDGDLLGLYRSILIEWQTMEGELFRLRHNPLLNGR